MFKQRQKLLFFVLLYTAFFSSFSLKATTNSVPVTPCSAPVNQPYNLRFIKTNSNCLWLSFDSATVDEHLIVVSSSPTLTNLPVDGTTYASGDSLGSARVVARSWNLQQTVYDLAPSTTYYFFVFVMNSCSSGPVYNTTNPLTGNRTTPSAPVNMPAAQPTNLVLNTIGSTSISGSFTPSGNSAYLVAYSTSPILTVKPVDEQNYAVGSAMGNSKVVSNGSSNSFSVSGLNAQTPYYFFIFAYDIPSCLCGNVYRAQNPLSGSIATPLVCVAPVSPPDGITFGSISSSTISGSFTANTADGYLVLYSTSATLTNSPVNGTIYTSRNTLGNTIVVSSVAASSFSISGLTASTTYYISVYGFNNTNCIGGPVYTATAVGGSVATPSVGLNYYFGTFHSHSQYSDGNGTPSADFSYGDTANCMDFLGISEHNHVNAGMSLANWPLGKAQATASTTPSFLAMYGMEWGVISSGGHVVIYGVPDLLGWDAGQYDRYVAMSDYTGIAGLFNVINSYGGNAFATLAHPNNSDFNNIMTTYNATADVAIVATAVESGPAFSTNTTYSDAASPVAYLPYYRNMLARGYHLGPTIDHDNHNVTHGHTTTARTVVMANSLTENAILDAMRSMHFYASEDCSGYVTFKANANLMGSIVSESGAPVFTVTTTTSNPVTSIKLYSGVSGSGTAATILTSTTTGTLTYTHTALTNGSSRYYYLDITESDGKRIITSPIWYTRND